MVYINIGTNLGNRSVNLHLALCRVQECYALCAVSDFVESEPWGFSSPHRFMNVCAAFESDEDPMAILDNLQRIEREISPASHRNPDGTYADRLIDIDIVAIEGIEMDSGRLILPHPHLNEREFFLKPLAQVKAKLDDQEKGRKKR